MKHQQAIEKILQKRLPNLKIKGLSEYGHIMLDSHPFYTYMSFEHDTITIHHFEKTAIQNTKKYTLSDPKLFTRIARQINQWHRVTMSNPDPVQETNPCLEIPNPFIKT